jgi:hypothetical protein
MKKKYNIFWREMDNWFVVKSKSGKSKDGFPLGEVLLRSKKEAEQYLKELAIEDGIISKYLPEDYDPRNIVAD